MYCESTHTQFHAILVMYASSNGLLHSLPRCYKVKLFIMQRSSVVNVKIKNCMSSHCSSLAKLSLSQSVWQNTHECHVSAIRSEAIRSRSRRAVPAVGSFLHSTSIAWLRDYKSQPKVKNTEETTKIKKCQQLDLTSPVSSICAAAAASH